MIVSELGDRLDRVGIGICRQPPRDCLDSDIWNGESVDAAVVALEPVDDLVVGDRPLVAVADPDRQLVALAEISDVETVTEPNPVAWHAGRRQHAATFLA